MKPQLCLILLVTPLALAGCDQQRPRERPAVAPAARVVGEAVNCIPLAQINETRVRDDWTIDFVRIGGQAWRNTLTSRCIGLNTDKAITYSTSLTQLCNTDIVYTLRTSPTPERGAACSLGKFVPVELQR